MGLGLPEGEEPGTPQLIKYLSGQKFPKLETLVLDDQHDFDLNDLAVLGPHWKERLPQLRKISLRFCRGLSTAVVVLEEGAWDLIGGAEEVDFSDAAVSASMLLGYILTDRVKFYPTIETIILPNEMQGSFESLASAPFGALKELYIGGFGWMGVQGGPLQQTQREKEDD